MGEIEIYSFKDLPRGSITTEEKIYTGHIEKKTKSCLVTIYEDNGEIITFSPEGFKFIKWEEKWKEKN